MDHSTVNKQAVLFLCTGNSARSQMAEALLRYFGSNHFEVHSAGLEPKGMNSYTVRVMDELGIDVRAQQSKSIQTYMGRKFFHYYITVCADADKNCPTALWAQSGQKLHWGFDDPAAQDGTDEQKLTKFREIRDQIAAKVQAWLKELKVPLLTQ